MPPFNNAIIKGEGMTGKKLLLVFKKLLPVYVYSGKNSACFISFI